jgi:hypothetical protein
MTLIKWTFQDFSTLLTTENIFCLIYYNYSNVSQLKRKIPRVPEKHFIYAASSQFSPWRVLIITDTIASPVINLATFWIYVTHDRCMTSTGIVKWRKTNDYDYEKRWGSRETGGGGNIHLLATFWIYVTHDNKLCIKSKKFTSIFNNKLNKRCFLLSTGLRNLGRSILWHRIHVLFMMYDVYWYCQMKKNEWLWLWKKVG